MQGLLQIDHQSSGRADTQREAVDREAFQRIHPELFFKPLHGRFINKGPLFYGGNIELFPEPFLDSFFVAAPHYDLFWIQRGEQGADVVQIALRDLELSGRDVQEGGAALILFEVQSADEIVFLLVKQLFVEGDAGGNEFRHAPLHKFLGEFRIFQLVADRYFVTGANQFRQMDVDGMVWEPGHVHEALLSVGFAGQDDAQHLADQHGVVGIGFIEIPDPVQEHRFRVLRLHREELLDQRGIFQYLSFRHASRLW